jgi:hypothetical protein
MKRKIITLALSFVFILLAIGMNAQAAQLVPLDSREAALVGATHVARFSYEDFAASTDTNTALIITNLSPIAAKELVECVAMVLETSFDTGNTNYTGSMALQVGDSSDADLFLTSTELASDGSEVFVKAGRDDAATATLTLQNVSLTDTNGVTASVCTNATAAIVAGVTGKKVYTAANYLKFTFTPNSEEALSANTKGAVLVYFRKLK